MTNPEPVPERLRIAPLAVVTLPKPFRRICLGMQIQRAEEDSQQQRFHHGEQMVGVHRLELWTFWV